MPSVFLVDNGSLRPGATRNLRRVAAALSERTGLAVEATSLLHSNKIPAEELDGIAAPTLGAVATRHAERGSREFVIVPFFFGPSRALTGYMVERMATLQQRFPQVSIRVASPLVDLEGPVDLRLAKILRDGVLASAPPDSLPAVALVDHGSPIPEVTAVRNVLAGQLSALLHEQASRVTGASMERRDGDEYRFNEPLLENLLDQPGFNQGTVVLSMLFLSPGRHAGPEGDIAGICADAEQRHPGLTTAISPLAGEHPSILDILVDRLNQALSGERFLLDLPPSPQP